MLLKVIILTCTTHLWLGRVSLFLLFLSSFITGMRICVVRVVGRKVVILVLRVEVKTPLLVSLLLLLRRPRDIELKRARKSSLAVGDRTCAKTFLPIFGMVRQELMLV